MFRKKLKPKVQVEWLIIGLGNPGPEYRGTRHNVGFEVIDLLATQNKIKLDQSKHKARIGEGEIGGIGVALIKPLTFMNLSGQAVAPLMRHYSLKPSQCLVIADDTDLPLGRVRIRIEGSAGGHNGHKSLISMLGTSEYPRIKLGIGRVDKDETIDHVLGRFEKSDQKVVDDMLELSVLAVESILRSGPTEAMNEIHTKS